MRSLIGLFSGTSKPERESDTNAVHARSLAEPVHVHCRNGHRARQRHIRTQRDALGRVTNSI